VSRVERDRVLTNKFRLTKTLELGATDVVEAGPGAVEEVRALTDGLGVDVSIEAIGYPSTLRTAAALVRSGGTIANIGVHGVPVELPMQDLWIHNVKRVRRAARGLRRVQERRGEQGAEGRHLGVGARHQRHGGGSTREGAVVGPARATRGSGRVITARSDVVPRPAHSLACDHASLPVEEIP
jgi:hypothetical protein